MVVPLRGPADQKDNNVAERNTTRQRSPQGNEVERRSNSVTEGASGGSSSERLASWTDGARASEASVGDSLLYSSSAAAGRVVTDGTSVSSPLERLTKDRKLHRSLTESVTKKNGVRSVPASHVTADEGSFRNLRQVPRADTHTEGLTREDRPFSNLSNRASNIPTDSLIGNQSREVYLHEGATYPGHRSVTRNHGVTERSRDDFPRNGDRRELNQLEGSANNYPSDKYIEYQSNEVILHEDTRDANFSGPNLDRTDIDERSKISLTELLCQKPEEIFCAQDKEGDNEIMLAIMKLESEYVILMIDQLVRRHTSKLLNLRNSDGYTALHLAVIVNLLSVTVKLMEAKVDYEIRDNKGNTPLHWACMMGHTIQVAALTGTYETMRDALQSRDSNRTDQEQESENNNVDDLGIEWRTPDRLPDSPTSIIRMHAGLRTDPAGVAWTQSVLRTRSVSMRNPGSTLQRRNGFLVNRTTKSKYDLKLFRKVAELPNYQGWNCLHLAAQNSHFHIMEYLVNILGADVNSLGGNRGMSVVHIAVESQDILLLMLMVNRLKVDVNLRTRDGWSPIEFAGFRSDLVSAKVLVTNGAHGSEYHNCRERASEGEIHDDDSDYYDDDS